MEKDRFLCNISEQFIDSDSIGIDFDTNFRNLASWDSLTGMSIIVMIEDLYKVHISDTDFRSFNTINDIYEFVLSKFKL